VRTCATVIAACVIGCGEQSTFGVGSPTALGMVERVVVLEAEADGAKDGASAVRGRASFIPSPDAPAGWRPADGTCEREPTPGNANAVRGGATVALDFGAPLELHWNAEQHEFRGEQDTSGRDLAWQPVATSSAGTGVWAFDSRRALQFGERPAAWIAERRPTGDVVVRWHGTYARKDLLVRVIGGAGERLVCAPGADQIVVPWWAMTLAGAQIELAATRHEHVLTDTGTLLVGAATIVVPVAEDAAQVLETLSAEQPAEEQPSRSSFGPNRVRKGTRPGSTRSSPS
jgi:hypothetical protein